MSQESRLTNPLVEVMSHKHRSQVQLYAEAFRDPRFSSGFGMYPPSTPKPKTTGTSSSWYILSDLIKFGFVGGLGIFLNQYVLILLMARFGEGLLLANAIVSSEVAVLINFALNDILVFRSRTGPGGLLNRVALFSMVASTDLIARIPLLWVLTSFVQVPWFRANVESILLTFGFRFLISEKRIWKKQ